MPYLDVNTPPLVRWLADQPESLASGYIQRLTNVFDYLDQNVYRHLAAGELLRAILQEVETARAESREPAFQFGYLTDHGEEHVRTVIARASDLVFDGNTVKFSAYEIYLLIQAIHLHDVGNIYGRAGHEGRLTEVMSALGPLLGDDAPERRAIHLIASAHGGRRNGSKDTIANLPPVDPVLHREVHFQSLAATLRLADELADDSTRAARFMLAANLVPESSEIYQRYALALHSVIVRPKLHTIALDFQFTQNDAVADFGKDDRRAYLLDEIFTRTLKMHCERMYCMRFMMDVARIDAIDVKIKVYKDSNSPYTLLDPIGYRLAERGYPNLAAMTITDICPDVLHTGISLRDLLLPPA